MSDAQKKEIAAALKYLEDLVETHVEMDLARKEMIASINQVKESVGT